MPSRPRAVALFDMDDTLVRANTAGLYFVDRYRNRELSRAQMARILWINLGYRLNLVDMAGLIRAGVTEVAGVPEQDMQAICQRLYDAEVRPRLCPRALEALRRHQADGDVCAIVTASTPYVARLLARELGIDHLLCTELEVDQGRFTGRLLGDPCFGPAKVDRARRLADDHGLPLREGWFYTDSHSDWPLLAAVGNPRVVRPDPRLRLLAWRKGWPVLPW